MKSRVESRKEYAAETILNLKEFGSFKHLSDFQWEIIENELRYAFSAGVDFALKKYKG